MRRSASRKWKLYERLVELYRARHPGVRAEYDKIITLPSGTQRHVDLWLEQDVPGLNRPLRIAINCKDYKGKLTRATVGAAQEQFEDLRADINILICPNGYDAGALEAAAKHRIECEVLTWEQVIETAWEAPFFHACVVVDEAVGIARPTAEDVERLVSFIQKPSLARYFFEVLKNAHWLPLLLQTAYFVERLNDSASWLSVAAARFVHIAAKEEPAATVAAIGAATNPGPLSAGLLIQAAEMLNPDHQSEAASAICQWEAIRYGNRHLPVGKLIETLAEAGRPEALALIHALLTPRKAGDDGGEDPPAGSRWRDFGAAAAIHRILIPRVPTLVETLPRASCEMLQALLEQYLREGHLRNYHRGSVEASDQNHTWVEIGDVLVDACRDGLVALCGRDPHAAEELLCGWLRHPDPLPRRLALHALRVSPHSFTALVRRELGRPENFDDYWVHHEFWRLAGESLPVLTTRGREQFLRRILAGPPPSGSEPQHDSERWILRCLQNIEPHLRPRECRRLQELAECHGRDEHPAFRGGYSRAFSGTTSPVSGEEMAQLSVGTIFDKLATFQPERSFTGPSPEGAARVLEDEVVRRPHEFLAELDAMPHLPYPVYYGHLFGGLRRVLEAGQEPCTDLDFRPAERLAASLIPHTDDPAAEDEWEQHSYGRWSWVRGDLSCWLEARCRRSELGIEAGIAVRGLLEALYQAARFDQEPVAPGDAFCASLNTEAGKLTHAVSAFTLSRLQEAQGGDPTDSAGILLRGGLKLLELLLERGDASVRAAVGAHLVPLYGVHGAWVQEHLSVILPDDEQNWLSSWEGFLFGARVLPATLAALLRPQYLRAVRRLAQQDTGTPEATAEHRLADQLADHLMVLYLRGEADQNDPESPILLLTSSKNDDALAGAALFLERELRISGADRERQWPLLRRWWELRAAALSSRPSDTGRKEASAFLHWLESLPESETLPDILPLLDPSVARIEDGTEAGQVLRFLAEQARQYPAEAFAVLQTLIQRNVPIFGIDRECARQVIGEAVLCGGAVGRCAIELAHRLGEHKGWYDLRDIVATPRPAGILPGGGAP